MLSFVPLQRTMLYVNIPSKETAFLLHASYSFNNQIDHVAILTSKNQAFFLLILPPPTLPHHLSGRSLSRNHEISKQLIYCNNIIFLITKCYLELNMKIMDCLSPCL